MVDIYDVNILEIISYPEYKPPKQYYDIAVIKLEQDVSFNHFVQPACLWGKQDVSELETTAILTGWGVLQEGSPQTSEELQAAVVDILDDQVCDRLVGSFCNRNWCGIQDHQICAGKLAGDIGASQVV